MEGLLCSCRKSLPPGFRFHPTDEELFMYYLKRKVMGKNLSPDAIAEVDVYRYAPWELPPMSSLKSRDLVWYFFCPRAKKYPNGGRANRATDCGYWKSTGTDRTMMYNSRSVGKIKTLIFHRGKPPKGERTDWVMHEYRLEDRLLVERGVSQDSYVICKIYEKSGLGPKNGESYGARFVEEEWDTDTDNDDDDDDDDDDNHVKERDSEVVPVDLGVERVGDSPDGSVSGLSCAVASSNDASPFPTAIAAFDDTNAGNLNTSAFEGAPLLAFAGNPNIVDASLGTACAFTSSMASPSVVATAAGDGAGSGTLDEDDLDRLLNFFSEEFDNCNDLFSGLGDLGIPSGQVDLDWSDVIEMDDLK